MKMFLRWISLVCLMLMTGCGLDGPVPHKPQPEATAAASQAAEPKPGETEKAATENTAAQEAVTVKSPTARSSQSRRRMKAGAPEAVTEKSATDQAPGTVREKADVGMGEKGRGYGGGIITTPVHVYFTAQELIILQHIEHAMQLYKGEHDGKPPKTQDEFMDRIIKENNIRLPTLPQGERYVYDPKTGELMIEKPSNQ